MKDILVVYNFWKLLRSSYKINAQAFVHINQGAPLLCCIVEVSVFARNLQTVLQVVAPFCILTNIE
jgi:hypothetical protein